MTTIDDVLMELSDAGEDVLVVSKARRLPLERWRNRASALPDSGLVHTVVTNRQVVFTPRHKFTSDLGSAAPITRPIDEVTRAFRPHPKLRNETLCVEFADSSTARFELPSHEQADLWLHGLSVALRDLHRWDALRRDDRSSFPNDGDPATPPGRT